MSKLTTTGSLRCESGMGFANVKATISAPYILGVSHCFKMKWIHAATDAAEMIQLQTERHHASEQSVSDHMGATCKTFATTDANDSITTSIEGTEPEPASRFIGMYLRPKAISQRCAAKNTWLMCSSVTVLRPALVMGMTEPTSNARLAAVGN